MDSASVGYLLPTHEAGTAHGASLPALIDLGTQAERAGFDAIWVPDSPFQFGVPDPFVVLSALAARTDRVKLGPSVLLAALRDPALLAQQFASLDALSGGRVIAALGYGAPTPAGEAQFAVNQSPFKSRFKKVEETIDAMRRLWAAPGVPLAVDGETVSIREMALSPAPAQPGGPPIWLAGMGPVAQRRAGRIADGWLPFLPDPTAYAEAHERVRDAAASAGREMSPVAGLYLTVAIDRSEDAARRRLRSEVERWYGVPYEVMSSVQAMFAGTPDGLDAYLEPYRDAGMSHVVLRIADSPTRGLEAAADLVPRLRVPVPVAGAVSDV
jgi:alkanesulfonate monooxygenase SsuD/methylene tetrahydromethanopterin reductase-like flavin-dependent oxidoreductase (luciferase family)